MSRFRAVILWACALGFVVVAPHAWGQTGSITGQVLDQAGAAIPNATVTATAGSTGLTQTTTSSSSGLYNFAALPPAVYTVSASATGFTSMTKTNVTLNIAATLPVNFNLTVGAASTTVNVTGVTAAPIETDSSQLSTVIDAKQINDLPLVLRDPYQLVLLSPGAVRAANNDGGFGVNGQRDRNNNFMLDGADNNDTSVPGIPTGLVNANPDSAQEFRVITNNFDAEFGRNTGAIIDVLTRGGTNTFHGSAYEFGRYNALGARDYFNTKANGPQDPYVRNDFGASLGGPILKDRLFFFLNGEVQRFRTTRTDNQQVPNAAFKSGVFTYNDGTLTPVNLNSPATNPNNLSGLGIDPTMAKLLAITPNGQQDLGDGVSSLLFFPSPDALNDYTLTGRFDYALTQKHQLTVRYTYTHGADSNPAHSEILPGVGYYNNIYTAHNGAISLASTLSSNVTNLARAGYNQNNAGFFCQGYQGIDAITGLDSFGHGRDLTLPYFAFGGGLTYGCGVLGDSNGQARLSSSLLFGDTMTVVKGAHSVKFGGEFRNVKDTSYEDFSSRESLTFENFLNYGAPAYTYNGGAGSAGEEPFEDLVWGATGAIANSAQNQFFTRTGARQGNDLTRFVQREWAIFAQDTWKVTPRFTAILGLRYEFNGVPFERDGNFANFFGNGQTATPANGFEFTDVGPGTGHQLYSDSWDLVEPRIGFAWDPKGDGRTAVRGGFGTFHDRIFDNIFGNAKSNPPFEASYNAFPFDGTTTTPLASNTPPPGTLIPSAFVFDGNYLEPIVINPHLKIPGTQSWNLGIQHQINDRLTAEVNYVGSHTVHALREVDGAPPQSGLVQQLLSQGVPASALQSTALYTGGQYTDNSGNTVTFGPAVNNTAFFHILYQTAAVNGNYNALQARLTEQVGGLSLTGSYTFAHALDNGSDPLVPGAGGAGLPRNPYNLASEYGNSDTDIRQRFVAAGTYALPIGHGQKYLSSGFLGRVLDGIQISGIQQVQTGLPFELRGTVDNLHAGVLDRPQLIGKPYPSNRGQKMAGGGVQTGPAVSAFGNAPFGEDVAIRRNAFHGPGFVDTDAVFQKSQTLHENLKLVLRVEGYNVFNHPNFSSPSALNIASPTFGQSTSEVGQNDGTTGARQLQGAIKVVF